MHACLTILVPYLHNRLRSHALSHAWPDAPSVDRRRKAWDLLSKLESYHSAAALLSFVVFLWNGRYGGNRKLPLGLRLKTVPIGIGRWPTGYCLSILCPLGD